MHAPTDEAWIDQVVLCHTKAQEEGRDDEGAAPCLAGGDEQDRHRTDRGHELQNAGGSSHRHGVRQPEKREPHRASGAHDQTCRELRPDIARERAVDIPKILAGPPLEVTVRQQSLGRATKAWSHCDQAEGDNGHDREPARIP